MFAVDFETYYDSGLSVKNYSPERYIHELLRANLPPYMVSLCSRAQTELMPYSGSVSKAPWGLLPDRPVFAAHNARFDAAIFQGCQKAGLIPAGISPTWVCTADMSVYHHAPRSLAGAAQYLLGEKTSKDLRDKMKGVRFSNLSGEKQEEMRQYCGRDAEICLRLAEKLMPTWPIAEQCISALNREAGMRGVCVDLALMAQGMNDLHVIMFDAEKKMPWREDAEADTATLSPKEIWRLCSQQGLPIPMRLDMKTGEQKPTLAQDEDEVVKWEETYGDKYPWIAAVRDYRKANILLRKLQTIERHSIDGVLYFSLLYFGAHTGRFSGSNGLNMQNLPGRRQSFFPLRKVFRARPGKTLCIIDWSQIEPRLLYWVAGDRAALDQLKTGVNIYEAYAIRNFGWAGEGLKEKNPRLYGLAKAAVLGAGYGCGRARYQQVAKTMGDVDLTPEEAAGQIDQYRRVNPAVIRLWERLNGAARTSAAAGRGFKIPLASGRQLCYYTPRLIGGLTAATCLDGVRRGHLHGGLLTENVIQALARDVFCEGMMRLADAGFVHLFHVHDEYVLEADDRDFADQEAAIRKCLLAPIPWLPDCPLDVKIEWRQTYA